LGGRERDAGRRGEQDPHEKLPHLTFISSSDERERGGATPASERLLEKETWRI